MDILECIVLFLTICIVAIALFVIFMAERTASTARTASASTTRTASASSARTGGRGQRFGQNTGKGFSKDQFKSWSKPGGKRHANRYQVEFGSMLDDEIIGDVLRQLFDDPPEPTPPDVILPTARERYTSGKHHYRPTLHNGQIGRASCRERVSSPV